MSKKTEQQALLEEPPFLLVVLPAHNEAGRIVPTLESIREYLAKQSYSYRVVVIENGSIDATAEVVRAFQKTMPELVLDTPNTCDGKGRAVQIGMQRYAAEWMLFMDADNATPLSELDVLWPFTKKGYEVVIGSRHLPDSLITTPQPLFRRVLGRTANWLIRLVLLPGIQDTQAGFKLFSQKAAKEIFSLQTIHRWGFDMELLAIARRLGYAVREVPIEWHDVGDSRLRPVQAALGTFTELLQIRWFAWRGRYTRARLSSSLSSSSSDRV